ncbi:MAG: NAD-dependent epimerase/dehydratase family protein [Acidimicrobiia bacterium]|nr:NAD-dependent epimerase/dehydratase family protein [Acidimicrobiia bacterium]
MSTDTFITGATGVVGGHLLRTLIDRGDRVTALVRSETDAEVMRSLGATPVLGDVTKPSGLSDAMWGASTVFHVAGVNEGCPKDVGLMESVNIGGAESVVEAAAHAGVGRVVLTSSVVAIGEAEGMIGTEETRHGGSYVSAYARSKHLGEQAALLAAERTGIELVVVNPASVQGPGRSSGSAELIRRVVTSRRPWLVDVTVSIVDIADCSRGHLLAAERGRPGERYILSGATLRVSDIVSIINHVAGTEIHPRWLSADLVRSVGLPVSRFVPSDRICPDMIRSLLHGHRYDNGRSRRDLGLTYTPIEDTFRTTIDWFRAEGLIP